ncbi:MAG: exodeoxyribonuclease V subunit gamma [Verrucomicrobia bacterium]|nr:exodeoxyribonuclease V subunit gamma [Verrucomicrobiota bacterium]
MASLDFIVSWDLEDLAGRVVAGLQGPGTDVLRPETVVVQSQGWRSGCAWRWRRDWGCA